MTAPLRAPSARRAAVLLVTALAAASACGGGRTREPVAPSRGSSTAAQRARAEPAVKLLVLGQLEPAGREADALLAGDPTSSVGAAVRAIARYHAAADRLLVSIEAAEREIASPSFDDTRLRASLRQAERALGEIDGDLAVAAADPDFSLELCPACWKHDWNRSGSVDDRDLLLFQVERGADGAEIPPGDPRRTPTFRLDVGDVHWARAMIAFQRAALDLVAAYRWNDAGRAVQMIFGEPQVLRFPLVDASLVTAARDQILAGLDQADRARLAYLAERDDDREWVPSPTQKNQGVPLPVDAALYRTWAAVTADLRRLVRGEEGLDLGEIVRAASPSWKSFRAGYLDLGRMLSAPRDIVIDVPALSRLGEGPEALAASFRIFFGVYYRDSMKPSPLVARLARMRDQVERGDEELGVKLRYLFWLN